MRESTITGLAAPQPVGEPDSLVGDDLAVALLGEVPDDAELSALREATSAPPTPLEYRLPYIDDPDVDPDTVRADFELRQWLHAAQMPAALGNSLADAANRYSARFKGMPDDATLAAERVASSEALRRLWGDDSERMVGLARTLVGELDKRFDGAVSGWLDATGAGNSLEVIAILAHHAELLALRNDNG